MNRSLKERARHYGVSVSTLAELERRLMEMPMELFLERLFGPGTAVYEPSTDLWIAPDPFHRGAGFGFIAVRRDKSSFKGIAYPSVEEGTTIQ